MPLFVKDNKSVLFIHIPKTAGTSIERAFKESGYQDKYLHMPGRGDGPDKAPCNPQHWHHGLIQRWLYTAEKVTSEFTIVRNPFTRCISEYFWKGQRPQNFNNDFFKGLQNFIVQNLNQYLTNEDIFQSTKEEFLKTGKKFTADNHFRPQWHFVGPKTKIFRFENLKPEVWNTLSTTYNLNVELATEYTKVPLSMERPTKFPQDFQVTEQFKELYTKVYGQDHTRFGYPMPF
jgi:hypothetical protein